MTNGSDREEPTLLIILTGTAYLEKEPIKSAKAKKKKLTIYAYVKVMSWPLRHFFHRS